MLYKYLSVNPGCRRWTLLNGLINYGWSIKKVGFLKLTSKKWPTNLSISLAVVLGAEQSTLCFLA